jgi:hypothetical protein
MFKVTVFQQFDKTAAASKFGHTTYANIYMGERLVSERGTMCLLPVLAFPGVGIDCPSTFLGLLTPSPFHTVPLPFLFVVWALCLLSMTEPAP